MPRFLTGILIVTCWLMPAAILTAQESANPTAPKDQAPAAKLPPGQRELNPAEKGPCEVEEIRGIAYGEASPFHPDKNKLDLYLPKGKTDFPVVVFVHGGGWTVGSRARFSPLGHFFARNGVGMAIVSYRLSPLAKHPDHIEDVAKAFAWTHRHIGEYGGLQDRIFLCGHSAGGHLCALLATNESFLKKENLKVDAIRAVIPISGVYKLNQGWTDEGPRTGWDWPGRRWRTYLVYPLLEIVVGHDEEVVKSASPLYHVTGKEPPFLLLYAQNDIMGLAKLTHDFQRELNAKGVTTESHEIPARSHSGLMVLMMLCEKDPANQIILKYIERHGAKNAGPVVAKEK